MKQLSTEGYQAVARRFQLLGDAGRLRILDLLRRRGELTVSAVALAIGCSQSHASRQLALLHGVEFVNRRREATAVYYVIADPAVFALCEIVCGRLEATPDRDRRPLFIADAS